MDSDHDEYEAAAGGGSPQASCSSLAVKKCKINKHGMVTLTNGVVSMKGLVLSNAVSSKGRDDDAMTLFDAKLSWGQSYALFTLVMCGKEHPVEKVSPHPYSISGER